MKWRFPFLQKKNRIENQLNRATRDFSLDNDVLLYP